MRRGWRGTLLRLRALLVAAAAGGGPAQAVQHQPAAQASPTPAEQAAWDRARGSGSAAAFQRYLELYPTGQYAEDAFRILVEKAWRAPRRPVPAPGPPDPLDRAAARAAASLSLY